MTSPGSDPYIRRIASGVGVAMIGDKAIVLDIRNDRYTLWDGTSALMLAVMSSGKPSKVSPDDCRRLERHGLVTGDAAIAGPWLTASDIRVPGDSALEGPEAGEVRPLDVLKSVWNCFRARIDLRHNTLHEVLTALPSASRGRTTHDLLAHARAFDRARRFVPVRPRCLPDALAYARMARRAGFAVDLVFGVKLHPFEAHCWVQSGGLVLTDPVDKVRRFTGVLAL